MSISEPTVTVTCDKCGYEYKFDMCALARNSWDLRYLEGQLKKAHWKGSPDDNEHVCESCIEDEGEVI